MLKKAKVEVGRKKNPDPEQSPLGVCLWPSAAFPSVEELGKQKSMAWGSLLICAAFRIQVFPSALVTAFNFFKKFICVKSIAILL